MKPGQQLHESRTYTVVRRLAGGGMGTVFEARQDGVAGFAKAVALKTIHRAGAADPEFVRLLTGEARLVADLVHENIVQVYGLGASEAGPFIVMELVDGIDLERWLQYHRQAERPLPVELAAFVASRVCRGLEYAHTRRGPAGEELGIVHRDICPRNVMVSFEGVVKITDFGIAKAREVMEQREDVLMGHVDYMAPEQLRVRPTDARSDLYALGLVLFELLTGRLPDGRGTPHAARLAAREAPPPDPREHRPEIPPELALVVRRALDPQPSRRFGAAGEMGFALEHHLYHDRFGPTNLSLRDYVREHFGDGVVPPARGEDDRLVEQRAGTLFGARLERPPWS